MADVTTASKMYALRELEGLLDEAIQRATHLIANEGSLDAFFVAITSLGKRVHVPSSENDGPPEGSTLEVLRAYVDERLGKREYRALALAQDVHYRPATPPAAAGPSEVDAPPAEGTTDTSQAETEGNGAADATTTPPEDPNDVAAAAGALAAGALAAGTPAIQVTLDHRDIEPVTCYLPYERTDDHMKPGELIVVQPLERFF